MTQKIFEVRKKWLLNYNYINFESEPFIFGPFGPQADMYQWEPLALMSSSEIGGLTGEGQTTTQIREYFSLYIWVTNFPFPQREASDDHRVAFS